MYPDAQDVDHYRVMLKCDSGTGRSDIDTLAGMMLNGFHLFPGLPNGTEAGQEMDQLYSSAKGGFYRNRDCLFEKRRQVAIAAGYGDKAKLSLNNIAYIIFCGEIEFKDQSTIVLDNIIELYFSPLQIENSCLKCGYFPATRKGLDHELVQHNIVEDTEGQIDTHRDPLGSFTISQRRKTTDVSMS